MTVELLRCRICESEYPAVANGICARCFGPLEPVYDWDAIASLVSRERIEAGPRSLWRYADLLPATPPPDAASGPGMTPLVPAPRLAESLGIGELWLKLDLANPTHSFKDRVVAVAAAKAQEFGLETLSCTSTGNLANAVAARAAASGMPAVIFCPAGLEPEKMLATTIYGARVYGVRGSYDDCSRLVSELAGEVEWGFVNVNLRSYYAEGSKTLAFEIVEQLGWETPTAVVCPIASGALFSKLWQGFEQFGRLGLIDERRPRLYGGQAEGCGPVAAAFAEGRRVTPVRPNSVVRSLAIGNPSDGDLAVATARASGGAIYAVPEEEVGENMAMLAESSGVFGETAAGVTLGALRAAVARGEIGERDRVVALVTGTGLKTPQVVEDEASGVLLEIDADIDLLLEELGGRDVIDPSANAAAESAADPVVDSLREQISGVDRELVAAVNRRLEIVRALHEHKQAHGIPLRDHGREARLLSELEHANAGPLSRQGLDDFFEHLLRLTRREIHGDDAGA